MEKLSRSGQPYHIRPLLSRSGSRPENTVFDFGGFTDGDRAVCIAQSFGVGKVVLEGFDFDNPSPKAGSDPAVKLRKLSWARRIIDSLDGRMQLVRLSE